ncbi:MAG: 16S rRNA (cytosine(1402)-N(4))-methyltransferase RsmH [Clostridia bacterium]|nr:16S rRNA (cytosine(1402)-N(4))-methyltransferase RsmH [Clostridia bacterium]
MSENTRHVPIMPKEVLESIITDRNGVYVDATLGFGGHSELILNELSAKGKLIGIDRDKEAIEASEHRLEKYGDRFRAIHGNYKDIEGYLRDEGIRMVDGILADLGISSYQIDTPDRGFSYNKNAPIDMRMNQQDKLSAYEVVNNYSVEELQRIIRIYGEEKFARQIAQQIQRQREKKEIETTYELVEIIKSAIPAPARRKGGNPAKRTFQAIRIHVNDELEGLSETIEGMIRLLKSGGRLCVITFHSLEDRIVKQVMRELEDPCTCPKDIPYCVCGKISLGRAYPRGGIVPTNEEMENNSRSKSARLRVFIKN